MGTVFNMVGAGGGKTNLAGAIITLGPTPIYDGSTKTQTIASVILNGVALTVNDDYTISSNTGISAGSYELVITGCNNFEGTATKAWSIAKASLTKPTVSSTPAYTGSAIVAPLSNYDESKMSKSGDTSATIVGTYTVYISLDDTANYQWSDGSTGQLALSWRIIKASLTKPTVSGTKTYTGSAQTVTLSNYNGDTMLLGGTYSATNAGTYSATVTLRDTANYQWSDGTTAPLSLSWTINKAAGSLSISPSSMTLNTSSPTGAITVTRAGNGTISAVSNNTSVATVSVSGNTVTVHSVNQSNGSATITISVAAGTNHNAPANKTCAVTCSFTSIYGVSWAYNNSSTALTRLTPASDPNGYVNASVATEPSPAVGSGAGSSPFDTIMPWSGMEEYNIISNAVSYKKGQSGFSRTSYDTCVYIPPFYYKVVDDSANSRRYFYVANGPATGFTLHPRSGKYVGRYNCGASAYNSLSGKAPFVSMTRATARAGARAKGTKWQLYDFATWNAIQLLYLVEFADWDSQSKIGKGNILSSAASNTGGTDSMSYHTGRASGTDGNVMCQYRGIEELWGNVYDWVDGANFNARAAYICLTPANYADDTSTNYTAAGVTLPSSGYIKKMGYSSAFPWALIPDTNGGSETTYVPDYVYSYTGWRVLFVGGSYGTSASTAPQRGLFYFDAYNASSYANAYIGPRLLFKS